MNTAKEQLFDVIVEIAKSVRAQCFRRIDQLQARLDSLDDANTKRAGDDSGVSGSWVPDELYSRGAVVQFGDERWRARMANWCVRPSEGSSWERIG